MPNRPTNRTNDEAAELESENIQGGIGTKSVGVTNTPDPNARGFVYLWNDDNEGQGHGNTRGRPPQTQATSAVTENTKYYYSTACATWGPPSEEFMNYLPLQNYKCLPLFTFGTMTTVTCPGIPEVTEIPEVPPPRHRRHLQ